MLERVSCDDGRLGCRYPGHDVETVDERRRAALVLRSPAPARIVHDVGERFRGSGMLDFDGLRRVREEIAVDGFLDCARREHGDQRGDHGRLTVDIFEPLQGVGFRAGVEDERGRVVLRLPSAFEVAGEAVRRRDPHG